ncbi:MAG: S8 family serine peptidase [Gammaproteobacteria bacterium]
MVALLILAVVPAAYSGELGHVAGAAMQPIGPSHSGRADSRATRLYIVQFRAPAAVTEAERPRDNSSVVQSGAGQSSHTPRSSSRDRARAAAAALLGSPSATGASQGGGSFSDRIGQHRRQRFDARAPAVRRYAEQLTATHDEALASVGAGDAKIYSYRYALNAVAARLTPAQAQKLGARKDVRQVWQDRSKFVETNASPGFLGLNAKQGGLRSDLGLDGENIVIGVIDSGIAPGHPSFADTEEADRPRLCKSTWAENSLLGMWLCKRFNRKPALLVYSPLPDWHGICQPGERFQSTDCNNKLIGARYYINGFLAEYQLDENEIRSARDADGHGTHIASIAAGNYVNATLSGTRVARISGMAPRARIAVYKACWLEPGAVRATCSTADLARAIDDAVADGVDVINYSVGSDDDINDLDDLALLAAADAGVLSVAAAGNEGPTPGSMLSPAAAPWVLAVGASSRSGNEFREAIRVNSPAALKKDYPAIEAGFTPRLKDVGPLTLRLVLVDDNTLGSFDGVAGTTYDGCEPVVNTQDVSGQIAFMQRGGCDFQVKIRNAQNAGARAALLYNTTGDPILMTGSRDSVGIPAMMIGQTDGEKLYDQLIDAGTGNEPLEVTLDKQIFLTVRDEGNQMQGFSGRGPSLWDPKILKPDVTAPGVDILAAQTPDVANNVRGEYFQYLSGTSMAVPHVAGVAALLKEAHPDWSPAMLRSALVTTGRQNIRKEDNQTAADPFDFGGGHIQPNQAIAPGLVYDAGPDDFDAYLCGRGDTRLGVDCAALAAAGFPADGSDLNQPSIAVDELVTEQVIHRRVTNVGTDTVYTSSVSTPTTIDVEVTPSVLSLATGESADVQIRFVSDGTRSDVWHFGSLTWSSATATVRSPIAIRTSPFAAPSLVHTEGSSGSVGVPLKVGYSGIYSPLLSGLEGSGQSQSEAIRAQLTNSVADDPDDFYTFVQPTTGTLPDSVRRIPIVVPEGTRYLRVALHNQNSSPDSDLDLYLYVCPGFGTCTAEATPSVNTGSEEVINVIPGEGQEFVPSGEYYVDVHGYDAPAGTATFRLFVWTVGANRGNGSLTAASSVTAGASQNLTVNWHGLADGEYLGLITHTDGTSTLDRTVIEITAP